MTKRLLFIPLFCIFCGLHSVAAQFINLELTVEPELSAAVEQSLDFGTLIANSGPSEINLGDVNMGIFSIRAFSNQQVHIELSYPDHLRHRDPSIRDEIPLELNISYNNSGINSYQNSTLIPEHEGIIKMAGQDFDGSDLWSILYIYVFGEINIGNIPNGLYTGDIVLSIEYE